MNLTQKADSWRALTTDLRALSTIFRKAGQARIFIGSLLSGALVVLVIAESDVTLPRRTVIQSSLFFIFFVVQPLAAWLLAWRNPLHTQDGLFDDLRRAHFPARLHPLVSKPAPVWSLRAGTSRRKIASLALASQGLLLFLSSYALSCLALSLAYREQRGLAFDLLAMLPVAFSIAWFQSAFYSVLRTWMGRLGLFLGMFFLIGMAVSSRLELPTGSALLPSFHLRHILGLLSGRVSFPGWASLLCVTVAAFGLSAAAVRRIPR